MKDNRWYESWNLEMQFWFSHLSPEIQEQIQDLVYWKVQFREAAAHVEEIKERLKQERLKRKLTKAHIRVISEQQCKAVELEIEDRLLQEWQHKMNWLRQRIDRTLDTVSREMQRRKQVARNLAAHLKAEHESHRAAERAHQASEDLALWEAFKTHIENPASDLADISEPDIHTLMEQMEESAHHRRKQAHLKREFKQFKTRQQQSYQDEENRTAWETFVHSLNAEETNKPEPPASEVSADTERIHQQQKEQQLREEYAHIQARKSASDVENQATWDAFVRELDSQPGIKPRKRNGQA